MGSGMIDDRNASAVTADKADNFKNNKSNKAGNIPVWQQHHSNQR